MAPGIHPRAALTSCLAASESGALSVLCEGGDVCVLRSSAAPSSARCTGATAQAWTRDGAIFAVAVGTAVELRRGADVSVLIARIVPSERKSKIADVAIAVVATETVDVVVATRKCALCGQSKPKSAFSKKQWRNSKRCRECIVDTAPPTAGASAPSALHADAPPSPLAARALRRHVLVAAASASGVRLYCVVLDAISPGTARRGASGAASLVHRSTTLRVSLVSSYSVCCVRFGGRSAGILAAAARDGHVAVWATAEHPSTQTSTQALWRGVVAERITSITFSPDGCALAIGSWDGVVSVYRAASSGGGPAPTAAAAWAHAGEDAPLRRISLAAPPRSRAARLAARTPTPWVRGSERLACGTFTAWSPDGGAIAIADGKRRALWLHFFARGRARANDGERCAEGADEGAGDDAEVGAAGEAAGLPALCVFVCRVDPRGLVPGVAGRRASGFNLVGLLPQPPSWAPELALVRMRWPPPVAAAASMCPTTGANDGGANDDDANDGGADPDVDALARDAAAAAEPAIAVADGAAGSTALAALVAASAVLPTLTRVPLVRVAPRSGDDARYDASHRAQRRVMLCSCAHGTVVLVLAAPAPYALQEGGARVGACGAAEVGDEPALVEIAWREGDFAAQVERTTLPLVAQHDALCAAIAPLVCCSTKLALTLGPRCIIAACGPRVFVRDRGGGLVPNRAQWEELVLRHPSAPPSEPPSAGALNVAGDSIVRCVALALGGGGCVALLRWQSGAARAFVL